MIKKPRKGMHLYLNSAYRKPGRRQSKQLYQKVTYPKFLTTTTTKLSPKILWLAMDSQHIN